MQRGTKKSAAQLRKPYYYTAYYWCPQCHKLYHDEKFKVVNQQLSFGGQQLEVKKIPEPTVSSQESFDAHIWTDGACVYNGTPRARAAWAFVSGETERAGLVEGKQTNNVAEGMAIYQALVWAVEKGYRKLRLHTDSQISLFNLKKPAYMVKSNREIFQNIADLVAKFHLDIEYVKVLGHSGDIQNERVDKLANELATKASNKIS